MSKRSQSRTSKACQECRRRKIRCDGLTLCTPCREKGLDSCIYREITRNRRRKQAIERRTSPRPFESQMWQARDSVEHDMPLATPEEPRASSAQPQRPYQVHYGASSNISLLYHLHQSFPPLFATEFSKITRNEFTGGLSPESGDEYMSQTTHKRKIQPPIWLPHSLAVEILEHFLAIHQLLTLLQPPDALRGELQSFYSTAEPALSNIRKRAFILVLAIASLATEHHRLADKLFTEFTQSYAPADDNLAITSIEIDLLLISLYLYHPNSDVADTTLADSTPVIMPRMGSRTTHIYLSDRQSARRFPLVYIETRRKARGRIVK